MFVNNGLFFVCLFFYLVVVLHSSALLRICQFASPFVLLVIFMATVANICGSGECVAEEGSSPAAAAAAVVVGVAAAAAAVERVDMASSSGHSCTCACFVKPGDDAFPK